MYVSEHRRRGSAAGAFDWPVPSDYPASLDRFYQQAAQLKLAIPVAFPRFHDIYAEGKSQKSYGRIPDEDGRTWAATLERAIRSKAPIVQLATWNDWGEGTGIEPMVEFGDRDLVQVQRSRRALIEPNFAYTATDLRLAYRLYQLRRKLDSPRQQAELDRIAASVAQGAVPQAWAALERLEDQSNPARGASSGQHGLRNSGS